MFYGKSIKRYLSRAQMFYAWGLTKQVLNYVSSAMVHDEVDMF